MTVDEAPPALRSEPDQTYALADEYDSALANWRRWIMAHEFWLSDTQRAAIEPHLPKNQPGARREDDRRVISGIVHVLRSGCRWRDCPAVYGPLTTISKSAP